MVAMVVIGPPSPLKNQCEWQVLWPKVWASPRLEFVVLDTGNEDFLGRPLDGEGGLTQSAKVPFGSCQPSLLQSRAKLCPKELTDLRGKQELELQ